MVCLSSKVAAGGEPAGPAQSQRRDDVDSIVELDARIERIAAGQLTEDEMKQIITLAMLAVGMMTAFASFPAEAQRNQVCVAGRGCVSATQAARSEEHTSELQSLR